VSADFVQRLTFRRAIVSVRLQREAMEKMAAT
jgi:hypothetical protein